MTKIEIKKIVKNKMYKENKEKTQNKFGDQYENIFKK